MKLVRYGAPGREKPGIIGEDGKIRDLSRIVKDIDGAMLASGGLAKIKKANLKRMKPVPGKPRIGACIGNVQNFIAIGLNYSDHAAEAGMPGLDHSSWYGVWGPKGMPADQVAAMNAAINDAIKALAASGQLVKIGVEPVIETPQQFDTFARGYQKRGDELLKSVNFQPT